MTGLSRTLPETWLDAALREAKPYELEDEVRAAYAELRESGVSEDEAAVGALRRVGFVEGGRERGGLDG